MGVDSELKGRGAVRNPANRFERLAYQRETWDADDPAPSTVFLRDAARSIVTFNDSPDVGFDASINPYRGCEHGCAYCYARPNHEYIGLSAGLDFESRILVKEDAPLLLRQELSRKGWKPQVIALSGVTDPYQPVERRLRLTRRCLEVLAEFRNPAAIVTKSDLVVRDVDILRTMAEWGGCRVFVSVTTLDRELAGKMEPRAATPARRLAAIAALTSEGVPTGVLTAPVIPGLTDHEIPAILKAAAEAGADAAGYVPLRLPHGVARLFEDWLSIHAPHRKVKVLARLHSLRGGKLNDPRFVSRMQGEGAYAREIRDLFDLSRRRAGLDQPVAALNVSEFRVSSPQRSLFG